MCWSSELNPTKFEIQQSNLEIVRLGIYVSVFHNSGHKKSYDLIYFITHDQLNVTSFF